VSDPPIGNATNESPQVARGWIAVGDKADGILLAVGDRARGLIAIGGKSFGIISIGGLSIGIISIGGIALGVLSLGGFGMGLIALGGLAIGWQACGGGALAWDFACGGAAAAFDRAYGGAAWSGYIAVGGYANAPIVNDPAARTFIESHWMVQAMKWQVAHNSIFIACVTASTLLLVRLLVPLFYRRRLRDALRS